MTLVTIDPRFNGPDGSANGGVACGTIAAFVPGPARVRLHHPPPLGRPLTVETREHDVVLLDGQRVVSTAVSAVLREPPRAPPSLHEARAGRARYRGQRDHLYPRCFVCGPLRDDGDGLRVFAGPVPGRDDIVATDWQPTPDMGNDRGHLDPVLAWASLDCPSYFALNVAPDRRFLLGQMTAALEPEIPTAAPLVVYAWRLGHEGRKHRAAAALADAQGRIWARAEHLWIELPSGDQSPA